MFQIMKYLCNTKMFTYVNVCIFLSVLAVYTSVTLTGIDLLIYYNSMLTFFIYPIGFYLLIAKLNKIYENISVKYRILLDKNFTYTYVVSVITICLIYSVVIAFMTGCVSCGIKNVSLFLLNGVYISAVYLLSSCIYLILYFYLSQDIAILLSSLFLIGHTFINFSISYFDKVYWNQESLMLWSFTSAIIAIIASFGLIYDAKRSDRLYEK